MGALLAPLPSPKLPSSSNSPASESSAAWTKGRHPHSVGWHQLCSPLWESPHSVTLKQSLMLTARLPGRRKNTDETQDANACAGVATPSSTLTFTALSGVLPDPQSLALSISPHMKGNVGFLSWGSLHLHQHTLCSDLFGTWLWLGWTLYDFDATSRLSTH